MEIPIPHAHNFLDNQILRSASLQFRIYSYLGTIQVLLRELLSKHKMKLSSNLLQVLFIATVPLILSKPMGDGTSPRRPRDGTKGRLNVADDDETPIRLMVKYLNDEAKSEMAKLGKNGRLDVDVADLRVAAFTTTCGKGKSLLSSANIESIEVDELLFADDYPKNHLRGEKQGQEHHRKLQEDFPYGLGLVQADQIPDYDTMPATPVTVCVIDTGVRYC